MRQEHSRDLFLGATVGVAVGDALGAPWQFQGRHQIASAAARVGDMAGGGPLKLQPGEWSAETGQMLMVLESYVANRGFEGIDVAGRLVEWFKTDPRGYRKEMQGILRELSEDPERWRTAAREHWYESAGVHSTNGALTRVVVAALASHSDLPAMIEQTILLSQITHFDPRCTDAALAINFLLAQCLGGRFSKDLLQQCWRFLDGLRDDPVYKKTALDYEKHILDTFANVTPLPTYADDHDAVPRALRHIKTMEYDDLGSSSYVVHTMQAAVWLLFNATSFEDGVTKAIALGGDTEVQGAVTGALLGARFGMAGIPTPWTEGLKDRRHLVNLSELLLNGTGTDA